MPGGFAGLPQAGVAAVLRDKAGVVALFDQLPVVEDENLRVALDGLDRANGLLQARQAGTGAVRRFEDGQTLAVFEQFGVQAGIGTGKPRFGTRHQRLRPVLDGDDKREADEEDEAEAPVPNEGDERGGKRGEDGSNQHVADDEGVVVGFVDGTGEQCI